MMQRLSGIDAGFIYGETPAWHMHAGLLLLVDPSSAPRPFTPERVRELIAARLNRIPPFRNRLVEVPMKLDRPVWIEDPDLDLHAHVRRVGVPPPGGVRELGELAGALLGIKLDRSRPLWEVWFLEGLADGRIALLVKMHHSAIDGVRAAELYRELFDLEPDAPDARAGGTRVHHERVPTEVELLARVPLSQLASPLAVGKTLVDLGRAGWRLMGLRRAPGFSLPPLPFQAPRTSLNQPITPHRDFAFAAVPLAGVKEIKTRFGVTVNDVILAFCASAVRAYLRRGDELPSRPLVAQVPVAVHQDGRHKPSGSAVPGTHVSVMGVALATHLADPVERLMAIHESARQAKGLHAALGDELVLNLAGVTPPMLFAAGVRSYSRLRLAEHHPPIFNFIMSSIPGPPVPLYLAGARIVGSFPVGPLFDGGGLNISTFSHDDSIGFGIVVCPEVVPEPWVIAEGIEAAYAELAAAPNPRKRRRKTA